MRVNACRVCGGDLAELWELGAFALTGYFPRPGEDVAREPMGVSHCQDCSLVQMHYHYDQDLYGATYGYRSGLNGSMVQHLMELQNDARIYAQLWHGDVVLDIGGNDGTLLRNFDDSFHKILIDPTAAKFAKYHDASTVAVRERFSAQSFFAASRGQQAKLVFSVAMFYDLDDPVGFAQEVYDCLEDDGI